MTDVKTGKVLVWASYVEEGPMRDVASEATAPVGERVQGRHRHGARRGAALAPSTKQCYSGGEHAINAQRPRRRQEARQVVRDARAGDGAEHQHRVRAARREEPRSRQARRASRAKLGWGQDMPFDVPVAPSTLTFPEDELGFARTAAGFWNTTLSPFQGANLATDGRERRRDGAPATSSSSVKDEVGEIYRGPSERAGDQARDGREHRQRGHDDDGDDRRQRHELPLVPRPQRPSLTSRTSASRARRARSRSPRPTGPSTRGSSGFAPSRKPEVAISVMVANRAQVAGQGDERRVRHAPRLLRRQGRARRERPEQPDRRDSPAPLTRS